MRTNVDLITKNYFLYYARLRLVNIFMSRLFTPHGYLQEAFRDLHIDCYPTITPLLN